MALQNILLSFQILYIISDLWETRLEIVIGVVYKQNK